MASIKMKEAFLLVAIVYALQNTYEACVDTDKLAAANKIMAKQMIMQSLAMEENVRLEGNSGVKRIRQFQDGTQPYHISSITNHKMLALHNHANHIRTVGLGELSAVLNGVQFRTRHNDYELRSPHRTLRDYGATEEIPFPEVPPSVLNKTTLEEQIVELREYFRAFVANTDKIRKFRPYFKPLLCYLEGAWILPDEAIEEPFQSDRHHVDALTWDELHDKVLFTSASGHKDEGENYAYLPTKIVGIGNNSVPIIAQWNYRVLCHQLKWDVLTNRMRPIDDFHVRMQYGWTKEQLEKSNAARFELNVHNSANFVDGHHTYTLLDKLMEQVPGMDNYRQRYHLDDTFGVRAMHPEYEGRTLSAGYYHRWYKVEKSGAMGTKIRHRGFNDKHIFMARTVHKKVAPFKMRSDCRQRTTGIECFYETEQRWTYAIPLEIVYLTPLNTWNPYNLKYRGHYRSDDGMKVRADGRRGGLTTSSALDGINDINFYMTPAKFFSGGEVNADAADTVRGAVGVLDQNGNVVKVVASGIRAFFPNISGVGFVRQRYPIAPMADDGATIYKELDALKDYLFNIINYPKIKKELDDENKPDPDTIGLTSGEYSMEFAEPSSEMGTDRHTHTVRLSSTDLNMLLVEKKPITVTSSTNNGHSHSLRIGYRRDEAGKQQLFYLHCDTLVYCKDGHDKSLTKVVY